MDENPDTQEDLGDGGKIKNWFQDNVRIILSVLIVIAIATGIYSYSKRTEMPMVSEELAFEEIEQQQGEEAVTIIGENEAEEGDGEDVATEEPETTQEATSGSETETETEAQPEPEPETAEDVQVSQPVAGSQASVSEETEESFIQTAVAGDSITTLSRKALRNYLEKNNDPSLTAEHKIYIEDYMRKHVGWSGSLHVGNQVTFSKTLIKNAIESSKTLNDSQLENLKKYSARVSNL